MMSIGKLEETSATHITKRQLLRLAMWLELNCDLCSDSPQRTWLGNSASPDPNPSNLI
jgi:hypothetical protein